jgi:hypothetical protein
VPDDEEASGWHLFWALTNATVAPGCGEGPLAFQPPHMLLGGWSRNAPMSRDFKRARHPSYAWHPYLDECKHPRLSLGQTRMLPFPHTWRWEAQYVNILLIS